MSAAVAAASTPLRGTLYDGRGRVIREGEDPRLAKARAMLAIAGGYVGARTDRRSMQEWTPLPRSADADTLGDLPMLRARSSDLLRNAPLAIGAINTVVTNAIGIGLRPQPRVDLDYVASRYGVTEDAVDAFERAAARLWRHHSEGRHFDVAGLETHPELQAKVLRAVLERGDCLGIRRWKPDRPGALFAHALQLVEGDLLCNPDGQLDREGFLGGIEMDADGAPLGYWIASRHEWEPLSLQPRTWKRVPARGAQTGERLVRHLAWRRRIRQSRGVPYLAVVIETLKQLDRYGDAELMAAVVAAMFTVFIKTTTPDFLGGLDADQAAAIAPKPVGLDASVPRKLKLGTGGVFELAPDEDIAVANPGRPNADYSPFVESKLREIGAALEIPFEILQKWFRASYSASRASRVEFWKFLAPVRGFSATQFCQPDYADLVSEAVALGYLKAPGFFEDPLARDAWCGSRWIGPAAGQIDELKEVQAAKARIDANLSTHEDETAALTGGDFEANLRQLAKERRRFHAEGLDRETVAERIVTEPTEPVPAPDADAADRADAEELAGAGA